jgi:Spy/CpxP family protein refolding chaperone
VVFVGQTQSQVSKSNQTVKPPDAERLRYMTPEERKKACEELFELLQDKNSRPEKIRQKMVALRQAREKARNQLAKVRQELREILNSRQEAKLVLLEVLD